MKKTFLSLFSITILAISFTIYAQTNYIELSIDDPGGNIVNPLLIPLKPGNDVQINLSGNVIATSDLGDENSGFIQALTNASIVTGGKSPTFTCSTLNGPDTSCDFILQDPTTIITTTTSNATTCDVYFNDILDTIVSPVIIQSNNMFTYETFDGGKYMVICDSTDGGDVVAIQTIRLTKAPTITMPNSVSITSGNNFNGTWGVVNVPETCSFTGDWPNGPAANVAPNGNGEFVNYPWQISFTALTEVKTLGVSCSNAAVNGVDPSAELVISIISNTSAWPSCQNPTSTQSILGGSEDRTILGTNGAIYDGTFLGWFANASSLNDVFGNIAFTLNKNTYIAAKFNSGDADISGVLQFNAPGGSLGFASNTFSISISTCPGDFSVDPNNEKCIKEGVSTSIFWSDDPNAGGKYCKLTKNTDYYINMVHSIEGGNNYETPGCSHADCGIAGTISQQFITPPTK